MEFVQRGFYPSSMSAERRLHGRLSGDRNHTMASPIATATVRKLRSFPALLLPTGAVLVLGASACLGATVIAPASLAALPAWLPLLLGCLGGSVAVIGGLLGRTLNPTDALDDFATTLHQSGRALLDSAGTVLAVDRSLTRLLRRPRNQLIGQHCREVLPPALWQMVMQECQRSRSLPQTGGPVTTFRPPPARLYVATNDSPAGTEIAEIAVEAVFERQCDSAGEVTWLVSALDATDRSVSAARAACLAQEQLALLHGSAEIVIELLADGTIQSGNERVRELLSQHTGTTLNLADLVVGEPQKLSKTLLAVAQSGLPLRLQLLRLRLPTADKGLVQLELEARLQLLPAALDRTDKTTGEPARLVLTGTDLGPLRRAQRRLAVRHTRLDTVYQHCPEAIAVIRNSDGHLIDCNPGFTRLLGYQPPTPKAPGTGVINLWAHEHEREAAHALLEHKVRAQAIKGNFMHADRQLVQVETNLIAIEVDGEPCTLYSCHDISNELAQEWKLRASEEKFARMFQSSPDATAIIRLHDGLIVDINPAVTSMVGCPRGALVGRSCFDPEVNPTKIDTRRLLTAMDPRKSLENIELTIRSRKGETVPVLASATPIEIEGDHHILLVGRDLRELNAVQRRLNRIEARFRGAFENAQLALLLVDMDGKIFQTNSYARDLLAFSEAQLDGLHVSRLLPTEDRVRLKSAIGELQSRGQGYIRSERRLLCQNGLELWTNFQVIMQQGETRDESYFIIQATDITDVKVSQKRMERMAFYDTLTDLANRRLFLDRLRQSVEHCERRNSHAALLYLDVDQFKRVNDTLGHEAGDTLLREVAQRLTESIRSEDTVGRLGGDEFTVLLYDVQHSGDASVVANKILKRLSEPMQISGHQLVITASIGVTSIPNDGSDPAALMKNADLAMYRAKERGRNNYQFYSEDMNTKALRTLHVENELRQSLERSEFLLYHQPKYNISDGTLGGVECLVRWQHPERGLIGPGEFIDVAEETGAIVPLGSWIVEAACIAAKEFNALSRRKFTTALNISPRQFRDPNLVNTIRRCLRTYDLMPGCLQIEITETMLMQDISAAELTVARLHELGIQLAIDDFGTGYSSLNYLKRFPINTVKVDRSFVKDIPGDADDCAITAAVIAMAHRLNMEVVAEGVETEAQLEFLRQQKCEFAQGFLFSKPLPVEAMRLTIQRDNLRDAPKALVVS